MERRCPDGWSASAARSRSSIACCVAPPIPVSRSTSATSPCCCRAHHCITLDSDTRLPRDVARQLIGIITHPLNRASSIRRSAAYRGLRHPAAARERDVMSAAVAFARLYAGHTGVDTTAVPTPTRISSAIRLARASTMWMPSPPRSKVRAGECAALPRPVRRPARARRARVRRRFQTITLERARARTTPASLDPRRLADPVLAVPVRADAARLKRTLPLISR